MRRSKRVQFLSALVSNIGCASTQGVVTRMIMGKSCSNLPVTSDQGPVSRQQQAPANRSGDGSPSHGICAQRSFLSAIAQQSEEAGIGSVIANHRRCKKVDWLFYPSLFVGDDGSVNIAYYGENDTADDTGRHGNMMGGSRYLRLPERWFFSHDPGPTCCRLP
jgi:hypothetical protein